MCSWDGKVGLGRFVKLSGKNRSILTWVTPFVFSHPNWDIRKFLPKNHPRFSIIWLWWLLLFLLVLLPLSLSRLLRSKYWWTLIDVGWERVRMWWTVSGGWSSCTSAGVAGCFTINAASIGIISCIKWPLRRPSANRHWSRRHMHAPWVTDPGAIILTIPLLHSRWQR